MTCEMSKIIESKEESAICCLEISVGLLELWYAVGCSKETYVRRLNKTIPEEAIVVRECESCEKRIKVKACRMYQSMKQLSNWKRQQMRKKCSRLTIYEGEVVKLPELNEQHRRAVKDKDEVIREMGKAAQIKPNFGKELDQVSSRQRRRKITELRNSVDTALKFTASFGMELKDVTFQTRQTNEEVVVSYGGESSSSSAVPSNNEAEQADDSEQLHKVLYLLDRFGVSDKFYHELSMIYPCLQRSYRVKEVRNSMNTSFDIFHLQGKKGCYRPLRETIISVLRAEVDDVTKLTTSPVEVKISGDGAPFTRNTSLVLLSFSLTSTQTNLSSKGVHTFAALNTSEKYGEMKEGFRPVLDEINDLIDNGLIEIEGEEIQLKLYFGGDYKFLLLFMGLNAAHSNFACLYCHVHKDKRWDITKTHELQTRNTMHSCLPTKSKGCIHPPLLNFEMEDIIIDELHLMLRIMDILIRNLVWAMVQLDLREKGERHITELVDTIRGCGISFKVTKPKDGGKGKDCYEWTTLGGNDKKKLLRKLPVHIPALLQGTEGDRLREVWKDFELILDIVGTLEPCDEMLVNLEAQTKSWVTLFLSLANSLEGHQRQNITPYMHIFVQHIPALMRKVGGIKRFTGQPVEKNNDDARRHYFSSNKLDGPKEVILSDARIEMLGAMGCEREVRPYSKKNTSYWEQGICAQRK